MHPPIALTAIEIRHIRVIVYTAGISGKGPGEIRWTASPGPEHGQDRAAARSRRSSPSVHPPSCLTIGGRRRPLGDEGRDLCGTRARRSFRSNGRSSPPPFGNANEICGAKRRSSGGRTPTWRRTPVADCRSKRGKTLASMRGDNTPDNRLASNTHRRPAASGRRALCLERMANSLRSRTLRL